MAWYGEKEQFEVACQTQDGRKLQEVGGHGMIEGGHRGARERLGEGLLESYQ